MNELIAKIEQWANDRNIIKGSKPIDQAMKLFSEFGELADNVGKGRDCRDDIGDVFVVLTIMAKQLGHSTMENHDIDLWNENQVEITLKDRVVLLSEKLTEFCFDAREGDVFHMVFDAVISQLKTIAIKSGTTLEECVQIAYDDISKRQGILWNGVFVKNTDENFNEIKSLFEKSIENNLSI